MTTKYQVKYLVTYIMGVDVDADTFEEAIKKAGDIMSKKITIDGIEEVDGKHQLAGFDDNDCWKAIG